jgi:DNA-directed RNA polymerase subunit D
MMVAEKRKDTGAKASRGENLEIKKVSEKGNTLKVLIKPIDPAFINAIRRSILNHIPMLAIHKVTIYENDSVMFDEFLSQRLAMVPLSVSGDSKPGEIVKLVLDKEDPDTVYSKDIKSTDPSIDVLEKKIPLVKLKKGQRIKADIEAMYGTGKEHSKWQPAIVGYQEVPEIVVSKECDLCNKCVENCTKKILEVKSKKVVVTDPTDCDLCAKCRDSCKKSALNLDYSSQEYLLTIESHGALAPKEILEKAVEVLQQKNSELSSAFKKL